jgi:hypothetical protein
VKLLAPLAAACLMCIGPVAVASEPGSQSSCDSRDPSVVVRIRDGRLVHLRVENQCPRRVVWVTWSPSDEGSESDFDVLVVDPGVQVDWSASDLDRLHDSVGLPLAASEYVAGRDRADYCWDTDGSVFEVTASGVGPGDACPRA